MSFTFDERRPDSPFVEVIWRTESERAGSFISTASTHSEMVVTRFLRATGLTHGLVVQIERAQHALKLLQHGMPILDTVEQAGYADQPHLTRSLKRLVGQTPAQILKLRTSI